MTNLVEQESRQAPGLARDLPVTPSDHRQKRDAGAGTRTRITQGVAAMQSQPLDLTAMEVMLLTDRIQNTDRDDGREIAKPFLLKLASAYLEMIGDRPKEGMCTIWVMESEAWLARSKFNSGDRTDADPKLGIHMLRKLYGILLAFDAAIDQWPEALEGDKRYVEQSLPIREVRDDDGNAEPSHS